MEVPLKPALPEGLKGIKPNLKARIIGCWEMIFQKYANLKYAGNRAATYTEQQHMKKVPNRHPNFAFLAFSLVFSLLVSPTLSAQDDAAAAAETTEAVADAGDGSPCGPGDAAKGKQLFNQNCAACHSLDRRMTGPPKTPLTQRY